MGADDALSASRAPPSTVLIALDGVHCAACVQRVQRSLASQVESCEVDLASRTASIHFDAQRIDVSDLLATLAREGFAPHALNTDTDSSEALREARERRRGIARIGIAILCAMQVMMFAWPVYFDEIAQPGIAGLLRWAQWLVATPAVLWAGWPFFDAAARALRQRTLTMEVPVALSVGIAYAVSALRTFEGSGLLYFDAATMFVALLLIGRHLERSTRARAAQHLRSLAQGVASSAQRLRPDGAIETVPVTRLRAGDRVRVACGEALPVDGRLEQVAELDEALITGESRPVLRQAQEWALAGSLNLGSEALVVRAEATGEQTRVAGILRLLQQAALRKPRVQRIADRVAGHFTLGVLLMAGVGGALAVAQGGDAVIRVVISVLIASCPCALSLAVPAALAAATSRLAAHGVLVARADRLLRLAEVDTVLLDKTGTLTHATLKVEQVQTLGAIDTAQARAIAAALECGLPHPIAQAFAEQTLASRLQAQQVRFAAGQGVSGIVDGQPYRLGPMPGPCTHRDPALTWITLSDSTQALAHFGLSSRLRDEALALVQHLARAGLHLRLLTGDSEAAAASIAARCGITEVFARQTPEQKLAHLHELQAQGRVVLAVGDGLNDAPFLAAADVAAAMPKGSAATQARADLLLVNDRLDGLWIAFDLARQLRRRVRENLAWALGYNLAILPLAFLGEIPPWLAAAGMSLSSLMVVANALRLRVAEAL